MTIQEHFRLLTQLRERMLNEREYALAIRLDNSISLVQRLMKDDGSKDRRFSGDTITAMGDLS